MDPLTAAAKGVAAVGKAGAAVAGTGLAAGAGLATGVSVSRAGGTNPKRFRVRFVKLSESVLDPLTAVATAGRAVGNVGGWLDLGMLLDIHEEKIMPR